MKKARQCVSEGVCVYVCVGEGGVEVGMSVCEWKKNGDDTRGAPIPPTTTTSPHTGSEKKSLENL